MNEYMRMAIEQARRGIERGDGGPFGSVIVKDGEVIGMGHNQVLKDDDATNHGEMVAIREASEKLANQEDLDSMYKKPDKMAGNVRIILKDMSLDLMLDAFALMMATVPKKVLIEEPKQISKDRFTVAEKIISIKNVVRDKKMVKFTELFDEDLTKSELINTFLALLELLKMQIIKAQQTAIFGEIDIIANEEGIDKEMEIDESKGNN